MDAASLWRLVMEASEHQRQIEMIIFSDDYGPRYRKALRLRRKADRRWARRFKGYQLAGRAA